VVLVRKHGGGPAVAPASGALRVRPPALHGHRIEYTIPMEPLDLGFAATQSMHDAIDVPAELGSMQLCCFPVLRRVAFHHAPAQPRRPSAASVVSSPRCRSKASRSSHRGSVLCAQRGKIQW
jgi:hypothetical protein